MTENLQHTLETMLADALAAVDKAGQSDEVEALRVAYLGKKGKLTEQLKQLGTLPADQRPVVGQWVNQAKVKLQEQIGARKQALEEQQRQKSLSKEQIDISLPGRGLDRGGSLFSM